MKISDKPKLIVICGPTGSGKTSLAVSLCKKFNGEIISADSRQVYREMDIGTSKEVQSQMLNVKCKNLGVPSALTINSVPIHLIDIVGPNKRYTVGQYKKDAERIIADILKRGKIPFLVGGTGLYIDVLVDNYDIPNSKVLSARAPLHEGRIRPDLRLRAPLHEGRGSREQVEKLMPRGGSREQDESKNQKSKIQIKNKKLEDLIDMLLKIDPACRDIVDLKNKRRVERALEFCLITGKKFSESRKKGERKYETLKISPRLEKEELHRRINKRVGEMMEKGLLEEVKKLVKKYGWQSEAMTGIGYRELRNYFECNPKRVLKRKKFLKEAIEKIKIDTRNYAKRQLTWFKRDKEIKRVENQEEAENLVRNFLK